MSAKTVGDVDSLLLMLTDEEVRAALVVYVKETCRRAQLEDPERLSITAKAFGDCVGAIGAFHGDFDGMRSALATWVADDEIWAILEPLGKEPDA